MEKCETLIFLSELKAISDQLFKHSSSTNRAFDEKMYKKLKSKIPRLIFFIYYGERAEIIVDLGRGGGQ